METHHCTKYDKEMLTNKKKYEYGKKSKNEKPWDNA